MITFIRLCFFLMKLAIYILFYAISVCWGGILVLLKVLFSYLYRNQNTYQHNDKHKNKNVNIENVINFD